VLARTAPVRTCVGCGARAVKSDLLRLVASGDEIVPDAEGRRPGRGAYLHPTRGCFEKAQRRRALTRALRKPGPLGTGRLAEYLGLLEPGSPGCGRPDRKTAVPMTTVPGGTDQGKQADIGMSDR
jgi:uncharacterized protein